jgi:hypothetical protein
VKRRTRWQLHWWNRVLNVLKFLNAVSKTDCRWVFAIGTNFGVLNGDTNRVRIVEAIAKQTSCRVAIETGTFLGETTRHLANCFERVITIEKHSGFANIAKLRLENHSNIEMLIGDSAVQLSDALTSISSKAFFVYLDAHWGSELPLGRELKALEGKTDYVCMIDDFAIEGTDYGFEEYNGIRIDTKLVHQFAPWLQYVFVPDYPPELSGPQHRGYCVFAAGEPGQYLDREWKALKLRVCPINH